MKISPITLFLLFLILFACEKDDEPKLSGSDIVGEWRHYKMVRKIIRPATNELISETTYPYPGTSGYEFFEDGTANYNGERWSDCMWVLENNVIVTQCQNPMNIYELNRDTMIILSIGLGGDTYYDYDYYYRLK